MAATENKYNAQGINFTKGIQGNYNENYETPR